jgi:mRNA-degrading endonuclease RelE of RelBE toxin-antitoxin system
LKITYTTSFNETYARLEKRDLPSVIGMLLKPELRAEAFGKALRAPLENCKSIRTGAAGQLRVVYLFGKDEALLLNVGQRNNQEVYTHAAQLLEELDL